MGKQMPLAMKPYLDDVKKLCDSLSKKELTATIQRLAERVSPQERSTWLETLKNASKKPSKVVAAPKLEEKITRLADEIRKRAYSIEEGEYWDEYDDYNGYRSWDDMPDNLSREHTETFKELLAEADHLFLSGDPAQAQDIYGGLLSIFSDPETDVSEWDIDIEVLETKARYCRCVYESTGIRNRAKAFYAAMQVDVEPRGFISDGDLRFYPMLSDIMEARSDTLPDSDMFFEAWKREVQKSTTRRGAMLLIEVVLLTAGMEEAAVLTDKLSKTYPMVYPFFIGLLQDCQMIDEMIDVAYRALEMLPCGPERASSAEYLAKAGFDRCDKELVLTGKREQFFSAPGDTLLRRLLQEAEGLGWKKELDGVLDFLSTNDFKPQSTLYTKALLLAGNIDAAFDALHKGHAVGWSYQEGGAGLLFGAVLYALVNSCESEPSVIIMLMNRYADREDMFGCLEEEDRHEKQNYFSRMIRRGLKIVPLSESRRKELLTWARKKAEARVTHIVSNNHRKAYGRAAEVLVAVAEVYEWNGNRSQAAELISKYRDTLFNRHRAFRAEVDECLAKTTVSCPGQKPAK